MICDVELEGGNMRAERRAGVLRCTTLLTAVASLLASPQAGSATEAWPRPALTSMPGLESLWDHFGAVLRSGIVIPADDERNRAAGNAFLAQVAPLFCPQMASNTSAVRSYEEQHHFAQDDLLRLDRFAEVSAREFRAFEERFTLEEDLACKKALIDLGPGGLGLVTFK